MKEIMDAVMNAVKRLDAATLKEIASYPSAEHAIYEALMNKFHPLGSCEIQGCERCIEKLLKLQDTAIVGNIMGGQPGRYSGFSTTHSRLLEKKLKERRDRSKT